MKVTELKAANTGLKEISPDHLGDDLEILDLRNNQLTSLKYDVMNKLGKVKNISLSGNPWICDCSTQEFFKFVIYNQARIYDFNDTYCTNGKRFKDLHESDICIDKILIMSISAAIFGLIGIILGLFYRFKKYIKIFLYAYNMCLWFASEEEIDKDKVYDAFVCFAADDLPIVEDIILGLESEPESFKCLVGIRDWPAGEMVTKLVRLNFISL